MALPVTLDLSALPALPSLSLEERCDLLDAAALYTH